MLIIWITEHTDSYRDANADSYSDKIRNVIALQRVKHSTSKGIGVFIFIEGIDCKDKVYSKTGSGHPGRLRPTRGISYHRVTRCYSLPARICLHFITSDNT